MCTYKKLSLSEISACPKVGEKTVLVKNFKLLSKSLRPLPLPKEDSEGNLYDEFNDPELRYRQRYVDLIVNSDVKETFIKRTQITNSIREFLNKREYLEVETPILPPPTMITLFALVS